MRDLEFLCGVAEGHEGENPHENADRVCLDAFEGADVDSLRIVAQPVAEVDALDHHGRPLVALEAGNSLEHVLDVAMAPVLALNGGDARDVAGAKGRGGGGAEHQQRDGEQEEQLEGRHGGGGELAQRQRARRIYADGNRGWWVGSVSRAACRIPESE